MRDYEAHAWEADELDPTNADELHNAVEQRTGDVLLASSMKYQALEPGPLNVRLARCGDSASSPVVLGTLAGFVRQSCRNADAAEICDRLQEFFRWDFGFCAVREGMEICGDDLVREAVMATSPVPRDVVEFIWLIGLLRLAGLSEPSEFARSAAEALAEGGADIRSVHSTVLATADRGFVDLARALLRVTTTPWSSRTVHLWYNALAMAARSTDRALRALLHQAALRGKPLLNWGANRDFRDRVGRDTFARFRDTPPHISKKIPEFGELQILCMDDPLVILNLGNAFDTCLRLGGPSNGKLVGWATNANIRIVAIVAEDGKLLARHTIALAIGPPAAVVKSKTYPAGNRLLEAEIDVFLEEFLRQTGLEEIPKYCAEVMTLCAPFHGDDFL